MEKIGQIIARQVHSAPQTKTESGPLEKYDSAPLATSSCPICKNAGFVHPLKEDGHPDYSSSVPCVCCRHEVYLRGCGLPARYPEWTFETFKLDKNIPSLKEAYDSAIAMADGKLKWLTLTGKPGNGKTHLAVAVCQRWVARGIPARYILVPDMLDWLRECFEKRKHGDWDEANFTQRMESLKNIPLLVLDDCGAEKSTEWAGEKLMMIIDYRYRNALPLMVNTNKAIDELLGDTEGRIGSRLMRYGKVVVIKAPDYARSEPSSE